MRFRFTVPDATNARLRELGRAAYRDNFLPMLDRRWYGQLLDACGKYEPEERDYAGFTADVLAMAVGDDDGILTVTVSDGDSPPEMHDNWSPDHGCPVPDIYPVHMMAAIQAMGGRFTYLGRGGMTPSGIVPATADVLTDEGRFRADAQESGRGEWSVVAGVPETREGRENALRVYEALAADGFLAPEPDSEYGESKPASQFPSPV